MSSEIFQKAKADSGVEYLRLAGLEEKYPVRTFFSTRNGGRSSGAYASLNMGFSTGDDRTLVGENRRMLFDFIGEDGYCEAVPHQVHGAQIACIRAQDVKAEEKKGIKRGLKLSFPDTDALITDAGNVLLTSLHADCIPVWLYDPENHAAGLAHAGWRGTAADIAAKTAQRMCEVFGSEKKDMMAFIGPGIGRCCFEVGSEVVRAFEELLGDIGDLCTDDGNGKYHLDLSGINAGLLRRAGIGSVAATEYVTCCRPDLFYSYRREGGVTGRMCAGIVLL